MHVKFILNSAKQMTTFRRLIAETLPMTLTACKLAIPLVLLASCSRTTPPVTHAAAPDTPRAKREVRVTGIVEAVHSSKILVPQIWSQGGPMTLTKLIPNGSKVAAGDLVAVFDAT